MTTLAAPPEVKFFQAWNCKSGLSSSAWREAGSSSVSCNIFCTSQVQAREKNFWSLRNLWTKHISSFSIEDRWKAKKPYWKLGQEETGFIYLSSTRSKNLAKGMGRQDPWLDPSINQLAVVGRPTFGRATVEDVRGWKQRFPLCRQKEHGQP